MCAQGLWITIAAVLARQVALTLDNRGVNRTLVTIELGKHLSMHMFETNEEHKVILWSVKSIFQESVKIPIVFTWVPVKVRASNSMAKVSQRHSGWSEHSKCLKDHKQDGQCQKWTGAERSEEQSCARNFCTMCFYSLPSSLRLPAALGGCITQIRAVYSGPSLRFYLNLNRIRRDDHVPSHVGIVPSCAKGITAM